MKKKTKAPRLKADGTPAKKPGRKPGAQKVAAVPTELQQPLALLKTMQATGLFSQEKLAALYLDLWTQVTTTSIQLKNVTLPVDAPPTVGTLIYSSPGAKDTTQLVPISNIQASSMTPNFSVLKSFFLSGHQKHPKLKDWITAEEIGEPLGMSADQVKKYSTEYCANRGFELPNVVAMKRVKDNGGYFMGVQTLVDDIGLPCFIDKELGAAGVWFLMEDGKIVWRNYWSPAAVKEIVSMIPPGKKFAALEAEHLKEQLKESLGQPA